MFAKFTQTMPFVKFPTKPNAEKNAAQLPPLYRPPKLFDRRLFGSRSSGEALWATSFTTYHYATHPNNPQQHLEAHCVEKWQARTTSSTHLAAIAIHGSALHVNQDSAHGEAPNQKLKNKVSRFEPSCPTTKVPMENPLIMAKARAVQ